METAPEAARAAGGAMACVFTLVFVLIALAAFAFWLWMLIDAITKCPSAENKRLMWVLVIVFLGIIGAAVYFFVQRPKNPPAAATAPPPGPPTTM